MSFQKRIFDCYIIRYAEIGIKGRNRRFFERKLVDNISKQISGSHKISPKITIENSRVILETSQEYNLSNIFGISSYSRAFRHDKDIESMKGISEIFADRIKKDKSVNSFRISCQRLDKNFSFTSPKIEEMIGEHVRKISGKNVKLKNPDYDIIIEVMQRKAYMTDHKKECYGGLPVGSEGKVFALIENPRSLLSAWLMMKRGCSVIPFAFQEKDIGLLQKFSPENMQLGLLKEHGEIKKMAENQDALAVVTGDILEEHERCWKGITELKPLIFWKDKGIKNKIEEIRSRG